MASSALSHIQYPEGKSSFGGKQTLKMISCVIRPEKLDAIKEKFKQIALVGGVTVTDVRGFGRQKGQTENHMGISFQPRLLSKVKLDIVVAHDEVDEVVQAIMQLTQTGHVGDGKIFITDILNAQRIRTGEKGVDAL